MNLYFVLMILDQLIRDNIYKVRIRTLYIIFIHLKGEFLITKSLGKTEIIEYINNA